MPQRRKPDPEKFCERCGEKLFRKQYGKNLEDRTVFLRRRYCSLHCANLRGTWGQSSRAQNRISQKFQKDCCESCGKTEYLHVHHINENWKDNRLENLITLCIGCHLGGHNRKEPVSCKCWQAVQRGGRIV